MKNFIIIGAAGYVAPRHMKAIKDTGHNLLAVMDPSDSVGVLDQYFPDAEYFNEFERLDRHVDKLKRSGKAIDYVSICSPNYLHDAHIRYGLRIGANVICEKPLVLNPRNLIGLKELEMEHGRKVYPILQLRYQPEIVALKKMVDNSAKSDYKVELNYITARGNWYAYSWKGESSKSGGIATNIGIHFFDMLTWIFGQVAHSHVTHRSPKAMKGVLQLEKAQVEWTLSIDEADLSESNKKNGIRSYRSIKVNENEIEFSDVFYDLHTICYQEILADKGYGIDDAMSSIDLVSKIRED